MASSITAAHPGRAEQPVLIAPDGSASSVFHYGVPPDAPAIMQAAKHIMPG